MGKTTRGTTPSPAQPELRTGENKPVHTIRYGSIKATIWCNDGEKGPFHTVTVSRSWRDEKNQWHDSTSYHFNDLPHLAKAVSDAHSWIAWTERRSQEPGQRDT